MKMKEIFLLLKMYEERIEWLKSQLTEKQLIKYDEKYHKKT